MKKASSPRPEAARNGDTTVNQEQEKVPRLPHERDQSADSQPDTDHSGGNRATGSQAHDDVERGITDTSRGEQSDQTYNRLADREAAHRASRKHTAG
jgi:hypothetical protein